jgi:ubiquinone/menaquinone biosynthesis C-methylase UbiE
VSVSAKIAYHLAELKTAANSASPSYVMPEFLETDRAILDIGCGIGQTFIGARLGADRLLVGLDIDTESLDWGRRQFGHIQFINGVAERLPFPDKSFDLVISRVSLPYTNIPQSLAEIERVLKANGRVWFTLHPLAKSIGELKQALRAFSVKDAVYFCYVIANGIGFHFLGSQFGFPFTHRTESFQTESAIRRSMLRAGFTDIGLKRGRHFVCTACKPAA